MWWLAAVMRNRYQLMFDPAGQLTRRPSGILDCWWMLLVRKTKFDYTNSAYCPQYKIWNSHIFGLDAPCPDPCTGSTGFLPSEIGVEALPMHTVACAGGGSCRGVEILCGGTTQQIEQSTVQTRRYTEENIMVECWNASTSILQLGHTISSGHNGRPYLLVGRIGWLMALLFHDFRFVVLRSEQNQRPKYR